MTHRWLTRALVAVAVPALLVPAVAPSAVAAPKPPAVPTLDAAVTIYPHLEGGTADVSREKVRSPGENCEKGKVITGATGRSAIYLPRFENVNQADSLVGADDEIVLVNAERFPSAAAAYRYLRAVQTDTRTCMEAEGPLGPDAKIRSKKIRSKLGVESWGLQITWKTKKASATMNALLVRRGKDVVSVYAIPMGKDGIAPSISKTVAFTRLALKTLG